MQCFTPIAWIQYKIGEIFSLKDEKGPMDFVFLDFRKAFDTISHKILIWDGRAGSKVDQTLAGWLNLENIVQ